MKTDLLLRSLLDLMLQMSDADMSVLIAAVENRTSAMSTIVGSSNHILWTELAKLGFLEDEGSPPIAQLDQMRVFSVVQESIPRLEELLSEFRQRKVHERMNEIFETLCVPAGKQIVERVYQSGGDNAEVQILMGLTLASVLGTCVASKYYDKAVQQVADLAKRRLADSVQH
ncbi:hypothetical protein [Bradyrhizobium sp. CCBAU 45389]|uniref:hypothetical protein n=1 Tax=Bradyrhizobium sp. CCBAU 45389 TaxID=858429 RepID=UPI002305C655|nr:hypothetical protein [Bradyrhizobium sp. CCBAU 45389]MDA9404821.1 hypothetical protein [Bradyrhizobium sp. CCBAU 45389]